MKKAKTIVSYPHTCSVFSFSRLAYFTFNKQCSILRVQSKRLCLMFFLQFLRLFLVLLFHSCCCHHRRCPKYTRIYQRLIRVQLRILFWNGQGHQLTESLSTDPLSSFSSPACTGIRNCVNHVTGNSANGVSGSAIERGLQRSGSPLKKSGASKLGQVRKKCRSPFPFHTGDIHWDPRNIKQLLACVPDSYDYSCTGVSSINSSDAAKSTSTTSLLINFTAIDNTNSLVAIEFE
ncbi:hypothetical protein DFH05DRAFT_704042 [Lentinula detonsa]|uniref:Uncharacterized protein n=1 Tax=Lentinula detonsa TaxID=2804962 RepID=A0A9W8P9L2_9AGAR|nr:hypothetical protein DFH05DRAFT_704042 [Lentinula detonsa]